MAQMAQADGVIDINATNRVIAEVFGDGYEFWKRDTKKTFVGAATALMMAGIGEDDTAVLLSELWGASREEFGA